MKSEKEESDVMADYVAGIYDTDLGFEHEGTTYEVRVINTPAIKTSRRKCQDCGKSERTALPDIQRIYVALTGEDIALDSPLGIILAKKASRVVKYTCESCSIDEAASLDLD